MWTGSLRDGNPDEDNMSELRQALADQEQIGIQPDEWFMDTEHIFSHIVWKMKVYRAKLSDANRPSTWGRMDPFSLSLGRPGRAPSIRFSECFHTDYERMAGEKRGVISSVFFFIESRPERLDISYCD